MYIQHRNKTGNNSLLLRQGKSGDMEKLRNKWKKKNEYNHKISFNAKNE